MLAHEAVADHLVERLAGATEVLRVGQAEDFATEVPPVIEREARDRVRAMGEEAAERGRIAARAGEVPGDGWFLAPTVAAGLDPGAPGAGHRGLRARWSRSRRWPRSRPPATWSSRSPSP